MEDDTFGDSIDRLRARGDHVFTVTSKTWLFFFIKRYERRALKLRDSFTYQRWGYKVHMGVTRGQTQLEIIPLDLP